MKNRFLLVASAVSLATASALAQQGEGTTVLVRSLVPFLPPSRQAAQTLCSALPTQYASAPRRLDHLAEAPPPDWVVRVLEQRHRGAVDAGRLWLKLSSVPRRETDESDSSAGHNLLLRGRPADVAACARDLDALAAAFGRPIEVVAWRLPLAAGELPAASWDAAALQQQLQRTPPAWTARARVRSGATMHLAQERDLGYLRDLDVEVAGRAAIFDPKVDVAFAGARVAVTAHSLPGDELMLDGSWLVSEPVALRELALGSERASLDLPEHRTAWATFAGRIGNGGALVVSGRGGGVGPDGFVLVVSARHVAPPAADPAPDFLVRPVSALLATGPSFVPQLGWRQTGDDQPAFTEQWRDGAITRLNLQELLDLPPSLGFEFTGPMLVVQGDAAGCRQVDAAVQSLCGQLRTVSVHTRVADGEGSLELVQPLLADRCGGAFVGREMAVVRDHEVEIAEKASIANPVVDVACSGLWLGAVATAVGPQWHVSGLWSLAAHEPPRERTLATPVGMTMQMIDCRTTSLPWNAPMPAGQEHVLGDGPAWTANGAATKVTVRLRTP